MSECLHADQRVRWHVIPVHPNPTLIDHWQVLILVLHDEDRDLGHLIGPGTGRRERTTDVGERLARLNCHVTSANEVALSVLGYLAGDEHQHASTRDDDLRVRPWNRQAIGIDAFKRHGLVFPTYTDTPGTRRRDRLLRLARLHPHAHPGRRVGFQPHRGRRAGRHHGRLSQERTTGFKPATLSLGSLTTTA